MSIPSSLVAFLKNLFIELGVAGVVGVVGVEEMEVVGVVVVLVFMAGVGPRTNVVLSGRGEETGASILEHTGAAIEERGEGADILDFF